MKPRAARAFQISVISDKLDELEQYHTRIEEFIARQIADLRACFEKELSERTDEERYEHEEFYFDEHALLSEVFTRTLRGTVLVVTYTLCEMSLETICSTEQKHHGYALTLRDLAGQGVERAKLYMSKVCGVTFPDESREWNRLMDLSMIRNALAHADGNVKRMRDPERIRKVAGRTPGLRLRRNFYLEIDQEYVASIIEDVRSLFSLLHKAFPD